METDRLLCYRFPRSVGNPQVGVVVVAVTGCT